MTAGSTHWIGDVELLAGLWYATRPSGQLSPTPHATRKAAAEALAREDRS